MEELDTSIDIDAPVHRVWEIFAALSAYPQWNPLIRRIDGELTLGGRLNVRVEPPEGMPMSFRPRIEALEPGRRLTWVGAFVHGRLFRGEHSFELVPLEGGRTRFVQRERFSGMLLPLLRRQIQGSTRRGFEAMNRALKQRAEGLSPPAGPPADGATRD